MARQLSPRLTRRRHLLRCALAAAVVANCWSGPLLAEEGPQRTANHHQRRTLPVQVPTPTPHPINVSSTTTNGTITAAQRRDGAERDNGAIRQNPYLRPTVSNAASVAPDQNPVVLRTGGESPRQQAKSVGNPGAAVRLKPIRPALTLRSVAGDEPQAPATTDSAIIASEPTEPGVIHPNFGPAAVRIEQQTEPTSFSFSDLNDDHSALDDCQPLIARATPAFLEPLPSSGEGEITTDEPIAFAETTAHINPHSPATDLPSPDSTTSLADATPTLFQLSDVQIAESDYDATSEDADVEPLQIEGVARLHRGGRVAIRAAELPAINVPTVERSDDELATRDNVAPLPSANRVALPQDEIVVAAESDTVNVADVVLGDAPATVPRRIRDDRDNDTNVVVAAPSVDTFALPTPKSLAEVQAIAKIENSQPAITAESPRVARPSKRLVIDVQTTRAEVVENASTMGEVARAELEAERVFSAEISESLTVGKAQTHSLVPNAAVKRVQLENREVCEAVLVGPHKLLLIGREVGTTKLAVWCGDATEPQIRQVQVVGDEHAPLGTSLEAVAKRLTETIATTYPGSRVRVVPEGTGLTVIGQTRDDRSAREIMRLVRNACLETVNDKLQVR